MRNIIGLIKSRRKSKLLAKGKGITILNFWILGVNRVSYRKHHVYMENFDNFFEIERFFQKWESWVEKNNKDKIQKYMHNSFQFRAWLTQHCLQTSSECIDF